MKWSVTLTDRLGPEILTVLEIKGQVLHRVRLHVKVPGLLLNLNALLTKKLPKFLSHVALMSVTEMVFLVAMMYSRHWTEMKTFSGMKKLPYSLRPQASRGKKSGSVVILFNYEGNGSPRPWRT